MQGFGRQTDTAFIGVQQDLETGAGVMHSALAAMLGIAETARTLKFQIQLLNR